MLGHSTIDDVFSQQHDRLNSINQALTAKRVRDRAGLEAERRELLHLKLKAKNAKERRLKNKLIISNPPPSSSDNVIDTGSTSAEPSILAPPPSKSLKHPHESSLFVPASVYRPSKRLNQFEANVEALHTVEEETQDLTGYPHVPDEIHHVLLDYNWDEESSSDKDYTQQTVPEDIYEEFYSQTPAPEDKNDTASSNDSDSDS
ncbi:hypothetical protein HK100_008593, partial [Physocladia obscura]